MPHWGSFLDLFQGWQTLALLDQLCPTGFYIAKKVFYICIWLKNQKKTISWHMKIWTSMLVSISKVIWEHGGLPLSLGFRWWPSCYFWISVTVSGCPTKAKIVTFWSSQDTRPFPELFLHFKLSVASYLLLFGSQEMWKYEHCIISFHLTRDLGLGPHCHMKKAFRDGWVGWDRTGSTVGA